MINDKCIVVKKDEVVPAAELAKKALKLYVLKGYSILDKKTRVSKSLFSGHSKKSKCDKPFFSGQACVGFACDLCCTPAKDKCIFACGGLQGLYFARNG